MQSHYALINNSLATASLPLLTEDQQTEAEHPKEYAELKEHFAYLQSAIKYTDKLRNKKCLNQNGDRCSLYDYLASLVRNTKTGAVTPEIQQHLPYYKVLVEKFKQLEAARKYLVEGRPNKSNKCWENETFKEKHASFNSVYEEHLFAIHRMLNDLKEPIERAITACEPNNQLSAEMKETQSPSDTTTAIAKPLPTKMPQQPLMIISSENGTHSKKQKTPQEEANAVHGYKDFQQAVRNFNDITISGFLKQGSDRYEIATKFLQEQEQATQLLTPDQLASYQDISKIIDYLVTAKKYVEETINYQESDLYKLQHGSLKTRYKEYQERIEKFIGWGYHVTAVLSSYGESQPARKRTSSTATIQGILPSTTTATAVNNETKDDARLKLVEELESQIQQLEAINEFFGKHTSTTIKTIESDEILAKYLSLIPAIEILDSLKSYHNNIIKYQNDLNSDPNHSANYQKFMHLYDALAFQNTLSTWSNRKAEIEAAVKAYEQATRATSSASQSSSTQTRKPK